MAQDKKPTVTTDGDLTHVVYYHNNGEIAQQGSFMNDLRTGEWSAFDITGKKIAKGFYAEGVKTGKWFFWTDDSLQEVDYSNNAVVAVTKWNNATQVVSNKQP